MTAQEVRQCITKYVQSKVLQDSTNKRLYSPKPSISDDTDGISKHRLMPTLKHENTQ